MPNTAVRRRAENRAFENDGDIRRQAEERLAADEERIVEGVAIPLQEQRPAEAGQPAAENDPGQDGRADADDRVDAVDRERAVHVPDFVSCGADAPGGADDVVHVGELGEDADQLRRLLRLGVASFGGRYRVFVSLITDSRSFQRLANPAARHGRGRGVRPGDNRCDARLRNARRATWACGITVFTSAIATIGR